jgi:hypothetical protein
MIKYRPRIALLVLVGACTQIARGQGNPETAPAPQVPKPNLPFRTGTSTSNGAIEAEAPYEGLLPEEALLFDPVSRPPRAPRRTSFAPGSFPAVAPAPPIYVEAQADEAEGPPRVPRTYTLPGLYGRGEQHFTEGVGRLAQPRFQATASFSIGYDDNPNQGLNLSPDQVTIPPAPAAPVVIPATPPQPILKPVFLGGGLVGFRVVGFTPGRPARTVPAASSQIPAQSSEASIFSQGSLNLSYTRTRLRSLLTFDLSAGLSYYFDREKDPTTKNGSLALNYMYRFTPRLRGTASADIAYLTESDLSRANTPVQQTGGPSISASTRTSLSYQFNRAFSTTGSLGYEALQFIESTAEAGDNQTVTTGIESRYQLNRRYAFVAELRHAITAYPNDSTRDSETDYFLLGGEFSFTDQFRGSLRAGQTTRTSNGSMGSSTSPYFEGSLDYQTTSRSSLAWSNRYGYEENPFRTGESVTYRTSLSYSYAFTPKFSGAISSSLALTTTTGSGELDEMEMGMEVETKENTFEHNIQLNYTVTRDFGLNLSYTFSEVKSDLEANSYNRNQILFGGQYRF